MLTVRWVLLITAPLLAALAAWALIYSLLHLARQPTGSAPAPVPSWLEYPPISLASLRAPERWLYALGFTALALALLGIEAAHWREISSALRAVLASAQQGDSDDAQAATGVPPLDSKSNIIKAARACHSELSSARWAARAAFAGLAVQGLVPLENGPLGSAGTLLHVAGANVFFMASLRHAWLILSALSAPAAAHLPLSRARAPLGWWAKAVAAAAAALPFIPATLLHPGRGIVDSTGSTPLADELAMERAGFTQHFMVGALVAYYALCSVDFFVLSQSALVDADDDGEDDAVSGGAESGEDGGVQGDKATAAAATNSNRDAASLDRLAQRLRAIAAKAEAEAEAAPAVDTPAPDAQAAAAAADAQAAEYAADMARESGGGAGGPRRRRPRAD